ncbi:hypothetical protein OAC97_04760 [Flavobacteriaceae bacterium]|nr:hypothetical protein [Flavobacteriaceae bacterium]
MKTIYLILIAIVSLTSCIEDENQLRSEDDLKIQGQWQLIEVYESNGGNINQWNSVENGYLYTFNTDGTFTSSRFTECSTGNYSLTDTLLTIDYDCPNFNTGIESPAGTFVESYSFENNELILVPTYMTCDEGCGWKFSKVTTNE